MPSLFASMQSSIRETIIADAWFAPMQSGVIVQDTGDLLNQINTSLQNLGLCILLLHASGDVSNGNLPGPYFSRIRIALQIAENVTLNRSKPIPKTALEAAERLLALLHHKTVGESYGLLLARGLQLIEAPKNATIAYQVTFDLSQGLKLSYP
jgi:hypothetical protein